MRRKSDAVMAGWMLNETRAWLCAKPAFVVGLKIYCPRSQTSSSTSTEEVAVLSPTVSLIM